MLKILMDVFYVISSALLGPVLVVMLALLGWTLVLLGGFIREYLGRGRVRRSLEQALAGMRHGQNSWLQFREVRSGLPCRLVHMVGEKTGDPAAIRRALALLDNDVTDALARHTFITRVSPMFGLMATLIPLGPALSGLAAGNMQALAGNLVVVFTATVIGLLVSGISYGMGLSRRAWYARDLLDLETIFAAVLVKDEVEYVA